MHLTCLISLCFVLSVYAQSLYNQLPVELMDEILDHVQDGRTLQSIRSSAKAWRYTAQNRLTVHIPPGATEQEIQNHVPRETTRLALENFEHLEFLSGYCGDHVTSLSYVSPMNPISSHMIMTLSSTFPKLKVLTFHENVTVNDLAATTESTHALYWPVDLKSLVLGIVSVSRNVLQQVMDSFTFHMLQELKMKMILPNYESRVPSVLNISNLQKKRYLYLQNHRPEFTIELIGIKDLASLRSLTLEGFTLRDLSGLDQFSHLEELNLVDCHVSFHTIPNLVGLKRLKRVDFTGTLRHGKEGYYDFIHHRLSPRVHNMTPLEVYFPGMIRMGSLWR